MLLFAAAALLLLGTTTTRQRRPTRLRSSEPDFGDMDAARARLEALFNAPEEVPGREREAPPQKKKKDPPVVDAVSADPLEAAREAGRAVREALEAGERLATVDVRASFLDARDAECYDEVLAGQWLALLQEHAGVVDEDLFVAPSEAKPFRDRLKTAARAVVVNPNFPVPPVEMDRAVVAYALWPLAAKAQALRICVTRRYPRPWGLFLDTEGRGDYRRVATFAADSPPSATTIQGALIDALQKLQDEGGNTGLQGHD